MIHTIPVLVTAHCSCCICTAPYNEHVYTVQCSHYSTVCSYYTLQYCMFTLQYCMFTLHTTVQYVHTTHYSTVCSHYSTVCSHYTLQYCMFILQYITIIYGKLFDYRRLFNDNKNILNKTSSRYSTYVQCHTTQQQYNTTIFV